MKRPSFLRVRKWLLLLLPFCAAGAFWYYFCGPALQNETFSDPWFRDVPRNVLRNRTNTRVPENRIWHVAQSQVDDANALLVREAAVPITASDALRLAGEPQSVILPTGRPYLVRCVTGLSEKRGQEVDIVGPDILVGTLDMVGDGPPITLHHRPLIVFLDRLPRNVYVDYSAVE